MQSGQSRGQDTVGQISRDVDTDVKRIQVIFAEESMSKYWFAMMKQDPQPVVLSVGQSTRPLAESIAMLAGHSVRRLIDVRTVPRSRQNPQVQP